MLWKQAFLSIEDLEGRFIYWGLQETVKEGSGNGVFFSVRGTRKECFTGDSE
jgi:hypothetical protein